MERKTYASFEGVDKAKFARLIRAGFQAELSRDYFACANPCRIVILEEPERYVGAIVVERIPKLHGVHYLDKIVRHPEFKGQGLGKMLWDELNGCSQKTVWRTGKDNMHRNFYTGKCDFMFSHNDSQYVIMGYGLTEEEKEKALAYAMRKKPTVIR